jgi:hypothetical protein
MMSPRIMRGPNLTADTAIRDALRTPKQRSRRPGGTPRPAAHMRVGDALHLIVAREVRICPPPPR